MKQKSLNLYDVDLRYNSELQKVDDNVMSISPQKDKETRKFVGIVIIMNDKQYCIPLTSGTKPKFNKKSQKDFIKIPHPTKKNENGAPKTIGVLNLNNMIPVSDSVITKVDISTRPYYDKGYTNLLVNELNWCRENYSTIVNKAEKLYEQITQFPNKDIGLTKRCCNFKKLEEVLENWDNNNRNNRQRKLVQSVASPKKRLSLNDQMANAKSKYGKQPSRSRAPKHIKSKKHGDSLE